MATTKSDFFLLYIAEINIEGLIQMFKNNFVRQYFFITLLYVFLYKQ